MGSAGERLKSYRARAEELRAAANVTRDPTSQDMFRSMAREYDLMAEHLEQDIKRGGETG
jgi:hypothetical protein